VQDSCGKCLVASSWFSVHLSALNITPTGWIFIKCLYGGFYSNLLELAFVKNRQK